MFSSARERRLFAEFEVVEASTADSGGLREQLAALPADRRRSRLLELVRSEAAAVRGQDDAQAIPADQALRDLGFDSLMSVELRTRLAAATGLTLARTLVFEHPTAEALAHHLARELRGEEDDVLAALRRLEPAITADSDQRPELIRHLQELLTRLGGGEPTPGGGGLDVATDEELFELIDGEADLR